MRKSIIQLIKSKNFKNQKNKTARKTKKGKDDTQKMHNCMELDSNAKLPDDSNSEQKMRQDFNTISMYMGIIQQNFKALKMYSQL